MNPPGRLALVVESNPDLADVIHNALTMDKLAREVVVMPDGRETLDYLLGRGVYGERDTSDMPCVILLIWPYLVWTLYSCCESCVPTSERSCYL